MEVFLYFRTEKAAGFFRSELEGDIDSTSRKMVHLLSLCSHYMLDSALNNLSNDYIALSEIDKAFDMIAELTNTFIRDYRECRENGDHAVTEEIMNHFKFYLHSCYSLHHHTEDNLIANYARFKKCEKMLEALIDT